MNYSSQEKTKAKRSFSREINARTRDHMAARTQQKRNKRLRLIVICSLLFIIFLFVARDVSFLINSILI